MKMNFMILSLYGMIFIQKNYKYKINLIINLNNYHINIINMSKTDTYFNALWKKSVNDMIHAINSDNNIRDFLLSYEPSESTGYTWSQDPQYKEYSDILDQKTECVHSGASFACCVREAVVHIKNYNIIYAEEVSDNDNTIETLDAI